MRLSPEQLDAFHRDGFIIIDDVFATEDLAPLIVEINGLVGSLAERLEEAGLIDDKAETDGFTTRLVELQSRWPGAATLLHAQAGVMGPELARIFAHPTLLDIMEQLLGPEVAGHPVWSLRPKTPLNPLATVPWHQDAAALAPGAEKTFQPSAWIPLVDVDEVAGPVQVLRGGHRFGKVFRHQLQREEGHEQSWYLEIPEHELPDGEVVSCPVAKGAVLLMHNLLPHRSTENYAKSVRWSVDFRWQRPGDDSGCRGQKEPILLRSAKPGFQIEWGDWCASNPFVASPDPEEGPFGTHLQAPWLKRWDTSPPTPRADFEPPDEDDPED